MSEKKKGRFCVAPFVALNTRGHGNIRVCCSILKTLSGIPKNMTVDQNNEQFEENEEKFIYEGDFYNLTEDTIKEIWNSKFYKDIRMKMVNGEYISNCEYCYNMEDNGLSSKRFGRNHHFLGNFDGEYENNEGIRPLHLETADLIKEAKDNNGHLERLPQWLEVRFSTICNLRCVMCSPSLSTSLFKEYDVNHDKLSRRQKGSLKIAKKYSGSGQLRDSEFFMKEIKKIAQGSRFFEFRGGEILQDSKMMEFIEELSLDKNAKNIYVDITTNGIGLNQKHIEILNRFYGGKLKLSIDAFAEENEFIRYPSKWSMTVKGMKAMQGLHDDWAPFIQPTISVFQAPTIVKLLEFLDDYEKSESPNIRLNITKVRGFDHLVLNLLPLSIRQESSKKVEEFINKSALCSASHKFGKKNKDSLLGLSKSLLEKESKDLKSLKQLVEHVDSLNLMRGIDYYKTFPHVHDLKKIYLEYKEQKELST